MTRLIIEQISAREAREISHMCFLNILPMQAFAFIGFCFHVCSNTKWLNLIQLFDLKQLVTDFTRVTPSSATIIDHIYSTNPENIAECFVPSYAVSDHFPVCTTRKINYKITKTAHMTTSYRCFKRVNDALFLSDLGTDLESFTLSASNVDDDLTSWFSIFQKQLDKHATSDRMVHT